MLRTSWNAKKSNETVLQEAETSRLLMEYMKTRQPFWPCDEKRETGTFFDNWDDQRKTQQGKTEKRCWMD